MIPKTLTLAVMLALAGRNRAKVFIHPRVGLCIG